MRRVLAMDGQTHPTANCGPLMMKLPHGMPCPTCGVEVGAEPTPKQLHELRQLWPTYPKGFWT